MTHCYLICGLTVASDLALPGARPSGFTGEPEVTIRRAPVAESLDGATVRRPRWEADDRRFLFRAMGAGRFLLLDGREIFYDPAGDAADCAIYLLGSVFGMLLHQRGRLVLHASAVEAGGKVALFCGRSGAGKSTLAAALARAGKGVVNDDVSAISFTEAGRPVVLSDSRYLKLSDEAVVSLDLEDRRGGRVAAHTPKFFVDPAVIAGPGAAEIGVIYILSEGGDGSAIRPLNTARSLLELQRNLYRPSIVRRTGQRTRYFDQLIAILQQVPVCELSRPPGLAYLSETVEVLERHWRAVPLAPDPVIEKKRVVTETLVEFSKAGHWLSSRVGDELVMMSVEDGNYVSISKVGARVWDLIDKPATLEAICGQLRREFKVTPEACRADVSLFLDEMVSKGAIKRTPDSTIRS